MRLNLLALDFQWFLSYTQIHTQSTSFLYFSCICCVDRCVSLTQMWAIFSKAHISKNSENWALGHHSASLHVTVTGKQEWLLRHPLHIGTIWHQLAWGQRLSELTCAASLVPWHKERICVKSMRMDVMKLKTYNKNNLSMHYPGSWIENEGVRCYFKFCLGTRLCQISLRSPKI